MGVPSLLAPLRVRGPRFAVARQIAGYMFITPAGVFLLAFSVIAIVVSFLLSFSDWSPIKERWGMVGLDNYRTTFSSWRFWNAFKNTAQYVGISVPAIAISSLGLAIIGNHARKLRSVFRTLYFVPTITPGVVVALIWIWMFRLDGGVNEILSKLGIEGPNWLLDSGTALLAIIIMSVWAAVGYYMVIFMAGLADIPQVYYDAAEVDGANRFQTFRHVTIPLLRNSLIFVVITLVIGSWQVFTQMFIMTRGGPAYSTESVQWEIYRIAFRSFDMGVASAMSWVLFAVIFVFTALQLKLFISRQIY